MIKKINGYVSKFGDNIDTDQIYPGRYLELTDPKDIGSHAMEGASPGYASQMKAPGIVVAGKNFGCGSSREHAVIALMHSGVTCVIASSFGRIFFRNAINLGLPAIVCKEAVLELNEGDHVTIDLEHGILTVVDEDKHLKTQRMPDYVRNILDKGGLIPSIREALKHD